MTTAWTIYLMRHGEAAWTSPDSERQLTARGVEQTQKVLAALGTGLASIQCILCSPYQRARQTAAEAMALTGLSASQHPCLTPDEPAIDTIGLLSPLIGDQSLIVAHQPLLGNMLSLLTTGSLREPYPFTTSEIVQLEVEAWAPDCARIVRVFRP